MMLPIWILYLVFTIVCIILVIYMFGNIYYILTENKIGVLSEAPLLWAIIIACGGPLVFAWCRFVLLDVILIRYNFKTGSWALPNLSKITQECCISSLDSIWGFNGGIRDKMFNNWKKLIDRD